MTTSPATLITKAASKQTYYTIRFLVDRERVDDAYRAYAYFRWMDDLLDDQVGSRVERMAVLKRQVELLDRCYRGEAPRDANLQERMLVELVRTDREPDSGLQAYLRNMMQVLAFDTQRRGRLISQTELNDYTRWLAIAVTEAIHHFIGHGAYAPHDATRYLAVSGAHIAHLLRDTFEDLEAGYYNIPREVLDAGHIGPQDVQTDAYRAWVRGRVRLARDYFKAAQGYFARVENRRAGLAGLAYTARFAWLLDTIEREGYRLRPQYTEGKSIGGGLRMSWLALSSMLNLRAAVALTEPVISQPLAKP